MPCLDFTSFWIPTSSSGSYAIWLKIYIFCGSNQALKLLFKYVDKFFLEFSHDLDKWGVFEPSKQKYNYFTKSVYDTFPNFFVMIQFFEHLWVQNWPFTYFLCHCFDFLHNFNVRIRSPWLFGTYFYSKIFSKCNLHTHYTVGSNKHEYSIYIMQACHR